MQYRTDPKSGARLSALGFGCMRFPRGISIDAQATEKLILRAIESGVNYFDTAYVYPGSETALGEILHKNNARDKINIATKLPHQQCKSYEDFDRIFNAQKERLKTGHIDYYLIHNLSDPRAWQRLASLGIEKWIEAKKSSGEIRNIGFSFHGAQAGFMEILDAYDWGFCQIQYNYMNEHYQAGRAGLEKAYAKGLAVIVMEPLLGGKLANGLPKKAEALFNAADPSRTPAAWSLLWLWNQPAVTVVLSGMNSMEQLEDNLAAADKSRAGSAAEAELSVIESAKKVFEEVHRVPCTGCNYCMPCPHGVNIPGCFSAYNALFSTGFVSGMTQYITGTNLMHPTENSRVTKCVKCGLCEKKCPQHIHIPKELEAAKKRLEPFWFAAALKLIRAVMGSQR